MNNRLKRIAVATSVFSLLCCLGSITTAQTSAQKLPYAADKLLSEPTVFAPGIISTGDYDSHPAFTPDGQTLYRR